MRLPLALALALAVTAAVAAIAIAVGMTTAMAAHTDTDADADATTAALPLPLPLVIASAPVQSLSLRSFVDPSSRLCTLSASGLGLTAISAADIDAADLSLCSPPVVVDLSHNRLRQLGPGLLHGLRQQPLQIFLDHNEFTSDAMQQMFNASNPVTSECTLCSPSFAAIDLSYNQLGPSFPAVLRLLQPNAKGSTTALYLLSCGITDVPAEAMLGSRVSWIDLSLNDLRAGLHSHTLAGTLIGHEPLVFVCAYCNLRSSSLVVGVFATAATSIKLQLANEIVSGSSDRLRGSRASINDSRLFTAERFTPPSAAHYAHRLPTTEEYIDSWSNCFHDFPTQVLTTTDLAAPSGTLYAANTIWSLLSIGDVISFSGALVAGLNADTLSVTIDLAPQVAAIALGLDPHRDGDFCPLHELARSLTHPRLVSPSRLIPSLVVRAYDQPLPSQQATRCAFPDCTGSTDCASSPLQYFGRIQVPIEPSCLVRQLGAWLTGAGFSNMESQAGAHTLVYSPPRFALWNPALNRSDWLDTQMLCDVRASHLFLPALPYSDDDPAQANFPFPPPDGLLSCLTVTTDSVDWSAVGVWSSGLLSGVDPSLGTIELDLVRLYRGLTPIPPGMLDPLLGGSVTLTFSTPCDQSGSCARMASRCPAWRNQSCEACPAGFTAMSKNAFFYCGLCPAGFTCDPAVSDSALPCPAGTFQALMGQSACNNCPVGTYSEFPRRTDPSTCVQCPPGRASNVEGADSRDRCALCAPGSASLAPGVAACPVCPPGYFQFDAGQLACVACGAGRYQPASNMTSESSCLLCPASTPYSVAGSGSQLQCTGDHPFCAPGNFTSPSAAQPCQSQCPLGSMCVGGVVAACPPGSFADRVGMAACTPCGAGFYGHRNGSFSVSDCLPCQLSSYSAAAVAAECQLCPVGTTSTVNGATSNSSCVSVPHCLTARTIGHAAPRPAKDDQYCALGSTVPIRMAHLAEAGVATLREFMAMTERISNASLADAPGQSGSSRAMAQLQSSTPPVSVSESTKLLNAIAAWLPLKLAPSLRLAAFGEDEVLSAYGATAAAFSNTSTAEVADPTQPSVRASTLSILFAVLLSVAFVPWLLFRWLPAGLAVVLDHFRMAHHTPIGSSPVSSPTRLGAAFTWAFVWVAIAVAIRLATDSNTSSSTELLPPSAAEFSDTARANWQITLRAYTGDAEGRMDQWCHNRSDSGIIRDQTGLSRSVTLRTAAAASHGGQSCDIAADCLDCGMDASASIDFSLPFNAQLVEWELWLNSAQADSWSRAYGVRAAPLDSLQPAQSTIEFTMIESYFVDSRTRATFAVSGNNGRPGSRAARSGFEFSFVRAHTVSPQSVLSFSASSTVGLSFSFTKSGVVLRTQLTHKQTALQLVAVIASAVVSLFALFGGAFKIVETQIFKRCGWSSGNVHTDGKGEKTSTATRPFEQSSQSQQSGSHAAADDEEDEDEDVAHVSFGHRPSIAAASPLGAVDRTGTGGGGGGGGSIRCDAGSLSERFLILDQLDTNRPVRELELSLSLDSRARGSLIARHSAVEEPWSDEATG